MDLRARGLRKKTASECLAFGGQAVSSGSSDSALSSCAQMWELFEAVQEAHPCAYKT